MGKETGQIVNHRQEGVEEKKKVRVPNRGGKEEKEERKWADQTVRILGNKQSTREFYVWTRA